MESEILFSVIMPVYNVEKYLKAAIDSILNQTYENFELILVDDCSPDNSPQICDDYASKDSRVKVIHKSKNEGLGFARNTGFRQAMGKNILYVDSDDTLEANCLEVLSRETEGYDITVFGINRFFEDKDGNVYKTEKLSPIPTVTENLKQSGQMLIELNKAKIFNFSCGKVYNKKFLSECNALFEKTKLIEDFLYNISLFQKTEKVKVIENCFYNYRRPAHQTLVNTFSPEFFNLVKRKFELECEMLKNTGAKNTENLQYLYFIYIKHLISAFVRNGSKAANLSGKKQKDLIKEYLTDSTTVFVINNYHPEGFPKKLLARIIKNQNVTLCYYLVLLIKTFKNRI